MATGDVQTGTYYIQRKTNSNNILKVVGEQPSDILNTFGDANEGKLYLNTMLSNVVGKPANAEALAAPQAKFMPGEEIRLQFETDSGGVGIDVSGTDGSELSIGYVEKDRNTGTLSTGKFSLASNEISTDPSPATGEAATLFRDTIGQKREVRLAGVYQAKFVQT